MEKTIEVLQVLIALCKSATFNCDADGARKITIAIAAAEAQVSTLQRKIVEDADIEEAIPDGETQ